MSHFLNHMRFIIINSVGQKNMPQKAIIFCIMYFHNDSHILSITTIVCFETWYLRLYISLSFSSMNMCQYKEINIIKKDNNTIYMLIKHQLSSPCIFKSETLGREEPVLQYIYIIKCFSVEQTCFWLSSYGHTQDYSRAVDIDIMTSSFSNSRELA